MKLEFSQEHGKLKINGGPVYLYVEAGSKNNCYFCGSQIDGVHYSMFLDQKSYYSSVKFFCEPCCAKIKILVGLV